MVNLVVGEKGNGKTKYMLEHANKEAKESDGLVIYLDKNSEHMFQLDRAIRLINVKEYPVNNLDALLGFICGLIAGNGDIVSIYFDSFLVLAEIGKEDAADAIKKLFVLGDRLGVKFTVSVSMDASELPEGYVEHVVKTL